MGSHRPIGEFGIFGNAKMRNANNDIATLFFLQLLGYGIGRLFGIMPRDAFEVIVGNKIRRTDTQAENTDLEAAPFNNDIRFYQPFERSALYIVIGAHDWKLSLGQMLRQAIYPIVELMASDG